MTKDTWYKIKFFFGVAAAAAAVIVLVLAMGSKPVSAQYQHPPLTPDVVQLPVALPACINLEDPELGINKVYTIIGTFEEMTLDGIVTEEELPDGCRIYPPAFPVEFLWLMPDEVRVFVRGVELYGFIYGAQSPLEVGLMYILIIVGPVEDRFVPSVGL